MEATKEHWDFWDVSNISSDLKEMEPRPSFSDLVHDHLSQLSEEFEHYFPITKYPWTGKEWNCDPSVNKPGKLGLRRWCSDKESAWYCKTHRFNPWVRKIPWRRKWQPTLVLLPGKFHGQRSLVGCSSWGHRVGHDWATEDTRKVTDFVLEEDQLPEITHNGGLKSRFETTSNLHPFWIKVKADYPETATKALKKNCFRFQHPILCGI